MEKNHAHVYSCTPRINGRLTFRTICRLFSRNHESVVVAFVTLQETLYYVSKNIETALNKQVHIEAESSQIYLSMAWSETHGLEEISKSCSIG
jgi:hypothetical protein